MKTQSHVFKLYCQFAGSCFLAILMFFGYVVKFYPQKLYGFDQLLTNIIRIDYPNRHAFFMWITKFGNPLSVTFLFLTLVSLLLFWKKYTEAIWFSLGILGIGGLINPLLKLFFQRDRPALIHLVKEHSYSFPSGHATTSMILYGSLFLLVGLFIAQRWLQWAFRLFFVFLILGIGTSRIYLGVHYPSDVLSGYCEGLAWLCFSYPFFKEQQFIWRFKQKQK